MIGFRHRAGTRIALACAAVFLAASSTIGLAAVAIAQFYMRTSLDRHILVAAETLMHTAAPGRGAMLKALEARQARTGDQLGYALFDRKGRRIGGSLHVARTPPGWHDVWIEDPVEGADPARAFASDLRNGDRLLVAGNRRPLMLVQSTVMWLYAFAVIATAILCGILAVVLARYLDRKLQPILLTADAVINGRFAERIRVVQARDEFDMAAVSINLMLDHTGMLIDNLQQVTSDIAHDLRTPLTRARVELEGALLAENAQQEVHIDRALDHLDRALALFSAILRLAEVEGVGRAREEPVDLDTLVADVCSSFQPMFEDVGGTLGYRADAAAIIRGDRAQLAMLLVNLLENILRHAGDGVSAMVDLKRSASYIQLRVRDDGPGVPSADLPRIFQRFVKLEPSRANEGFGLGLSLVKAIADAHRARINARNLAPGLEVTVDFDAMPKDTEKYRSRKVI